MEEGKSLTKEQILKAREVIEKSEKFDTYFVTEDDVLWGAKRLTTSDKVKSNGKINP